MREGRSIRFGDLDIAVFNLGDRFLAVSNRCPHKDGPLSEGIVSGDTVVCPLHSWKVGLETGEVSRPANTLACVQTFRVRVEAGIILVEFPAEPAARLDPSAIGIECGGMPGPSKTSHVGIDDAEIRKIGA